MSWTPISSASSTSWSEIGYSRNEEMGYFSVLTFPARYYPLGFWQYPYSWSWVGISNISTEWSSI